MSDLYDQVQDHEDRISSLEDSSSQDESDTADLQDRMSSVEEKAGQLSFPLSQETIDLIKEVFPVGVVTLFGGTATITDPRISVGSNIQLSVSAVGGSQGMLSYVAAAGSAVITSSDAGDTSDVSYVIFS